MKKGYRIGANPQTVAFFHFSALSGQANMNTPPAMQIVASWFVWLSFGGPNRDRTDDLTDANRTLSQLSYRPIFSHFR